MAVVTMQDGSSYTVNTLLADGDSNAKLYKSNQSEKGFLTVGLSLAPANESGYELCASRSAGCTQACLFTSGMGNIPQVKAARIAKARLFMEQRDTFLFMLLEELTKWHRKAYKQGKRLACRLNVVSDVMWEKICPEIFSIFRHVQFYDYTKHIKRALKYSWSRMSGDESFPHNYHLTFSRSESNDYDCDTLMDMDSPINIAVVFDSKELPEYWHGRKVVNGDETDLRFLDEPGTIVGLYAKGRGKRDSSGFVVPTLDLIKRS